MYIYSASKEKNPDAAEVRKTSGAAIGAYIVVHKDNAMAKPGDYTTGKLDVVEAGGMVQVKNGLPCWLAEKAHHALCGGEVGMVENTDELSIPMVYLDRKNLKAFKCVIPDGTKYLSASNGKAVAERLIVNEEIDTDSLPIVTPVDGESYTVCQLSR